LVHLNILNNLFLPSKAGLFELFASVKRLSVFEESNVICADVINKIHT